MIKVLFLVLVSGFIFGCGSFSSIRAPASETKNIEPTDYVDVINKFASIELDRENFTYRFGGVPIKVFAVERNRYDHGSVAPAAQEFCRLMGYNGLGRSYIYSYNVKSGNVGELTVDLYSGLNKMKLREVKETTGLTPSNGLANLIKKGRIQGWSAESGETLVFDYITCK